MRVVSTFDPRAWGGFVKKNILSWLEFTDFELVVYHEGEQPKLDHPRLVWRQFEDIPGVMDFLNEAARFAPACGKFDVYDYNFDAHKFARKVYVQCDAAQEECDVLIWLDSDVEILRPLSSGNIENVLNGMPIARYARPGYHSETGVVLWDMRQNITIQFFIAYITLYKNRRIYCLPRGWHDCWALDYVIDKMAIPTTNLGRGGDFSSPHAEQLHVVPDSELGTFLRHDKGQRKYAA